MKGFIYFFFLLAVLPLVFCQTAPGWQRFNFTTQAISVGQSYYNLLPPCSIQLYSFTYNQPAGNPEGYIKAQLNIIDAADEFTFALFRGPIPSSIDGLSQPLEEETCDPDDSILCELSLPCDFNYGAFFIGVYNNQDDSLYEYNFTVYTPTVTVIPLSSPPFAYEVLDSEGNRNFESIDSLQNYDHFRFQITNYPIGATLRVNLVATELDATELSVNYAPSITGYNNLAGTCYDVSNDVENESNDTITVELEYCSYGAGWYHVAVARLSGPGEANYTLTADFDTVNLITIPSVQYLTSGTLFSNIGIKGTYQYYKYTFTVGQVGPNDYLIVTVSAVNDEPNGEITLGVDFNDLTGPQGDCDTNIAECNTSPSQTTCSVVIYPCEFVPGDWYFGVYAEDFNDNSRLEYSLNVTKASSVASPISLSGIVGTATSSINENQYAHYVLSIAEQDLYEDSFLFVELYTNFDKDDATFYLNYGGYAGEEPCYEYDRVCHIVEYGSGSDPYNRGACHFLLTRCRM
jgi:hypothetical protein